MDPGQRCNPQSIVTTCSLSAYCTYDPLSILIACSLSVFCSGNPQSSLIACSLSVRCSDKPSECSHHLPLSVHCVCHAAGMQLHHIQHCQAMGCNSWRLTECRHSVLSQMHEHVMHSSKQSPPPLHKVCVTVSAFVLQLESDVPIPAAPALPAFACCMHVSILSNSATCVADILGCPAAAEKSDMASPAGRCRTPRCRCTQRQCR